MNIAFDFDGVIAQYPPFLPKQIINSLYRKNRKSLRLSPPNQLMRRLKYLSHHPLLRQPLRDHLQTMQTLKKTPNTQLFIISGRYSFLKKRTAAWIKKHNLEALFDGIYFNDNDEQPHLFKERMLQTLQINSFIDDDIVTLKNLASKLPNITFYWYNFDNAKLDGPLPKNIFVLTSLKELKFQ
jgi:hypothetical protein